MPSPSVTSRVLLLLGLFGALPYGAGAQSTPAPGTQQPQAKPVAPNGKILFERHEAAPVDTPDVPDAPIPGEAQTPRATARGVSSSNHRTRSATLRRRNQPATAPAATQSEVPATEVPAGEPAVSSSSLSDEGISPNSVIVLTHSDVEAARKTADAQRTAIAVAAQDLDLHLNAHTGKAEVRAQLLIRNTTREPLRQVPLRISGALHWESARPTGAATPLILQQYHLPDDLDHTGFATELLVTLPQPLLPGTTVALDLYYGGPLTTSTARLTALGAPAGRAALTDWDTVTDTFTGLRGLGNVLWYPVTGAPALLRDGSAVTDSVEASRTKDLNSRFELRLTLQYSGSRPDAAFFCGERQALTPLAPGSPENKEEGFVTAQWKRQPLGLHTPSLFVASGAPQEMASGLLRVVTDRADTAAATGEAAARIRPMLAEWLGAAPARPLDVLDLPIPGATGFADGSLVVAPLTTAPVAVLAPSFVEPLASAWLPAGIVAPWLRDGIPAFLQAVWAERTAGRAGALAGLASVAKSMQQQAAVSSTTPGISSSQPVAALAGAANPLASCIDPLCARNKAAYVFEMLRNLLGDSPLQQAVSGWVVQQEQSPGRSAAEETAGMEKILQQVAGKRDLHWFFANWIDADHGLPDLRIVLVAPRRVERSTPVLSLPQARRPVAGPIGAEPVAPTDPRDMSDRDAEALAAANGGGAGPAPGSWMVAVEVQNAGSADAEVPITVRAGGLTNTLPLRIAAHSRATIRVPFEADPAEVLVNDGSVPEVETSIHRKTIGSLPAAQ